MQSMEVLLESFLSSDWLVRQAAVHVFKHTGAALIARHTKACVLRSVWKFMH